MKTAITTKTTAPTSGQRQAMTPAMPSITPTDGATPMKILIVTVS